MAFIQSQTSRAYLRSDRVERGNRSYSTVWNGCSTKVS